MKIISAIFTAASAALSCAADTGTALRSAMDITGYVNGRPCGPAAFAITATVISAKSGTDFFHLQDDTGATRLVNPHREVLNPGDIVFACGTLAFDDVGNAKSGSNDLVTVIGHTSPPAPEHIPLRGLDIRRHGHRLIRTEGVVTDVFRDEIDDEDHFMVIADGSRRIPVLITKPYDLESRRFIDAKVQVTGIFFGRAIAYRTYSGPFIESFGMPRILEQSKDSPFDMPPLSFYPVPSPEEISALPRRTVTGHVLAAWDQGNVLIAVGENKPVHVKLLDDTPLPASGSLITASGYPTTDLFRINLSRAIYRQEDDPSGFSPPPATDCDPSEIMIDDRRPTGRAMRFLHGQTIRLTGIVQKVPGKENSASTIHMECGGVLVTVESGTSGLDLSAYPDGTELCITGTCVLESDQWSADRPVPNLKGMKAVLRHRGDLAVTGRPPWWTPGRLAGVIAVLLSALLASAFWTRYLNRLVNRRSLELMREKMKKEAAQLKTGERTRLAVELHDSLSQNLEGIACQVAATRTLLKTAPGSAAGCLDTAERMLDSCRLELRRCLFDLRGRALEERDFSSAIRMTLAPLCTDTDVSVRFNVRRAHFDDSSTHAVLCITRELVSNAIRHGRASKVTVAGEFHDGKLRFSVRDNGTGFEPSSSPGPSEGHFGLEGIRERAARFGGSVSIESHPGQGTRVIVTLGPDNNANQQDS